MSNQVPPDDNSDWENLSVQIQEVFPAAALDALHRCQTKSKTLPCGRPLLRAHLNRKVMDLLLKEMTRKLDVYVRQRSLKKSAAREKILKTIIYEARHFRIPDLIFTIRKKYPNIGQATIYRTLPVLVDSKVLQEGPTDPNGQVYYELAGHSHHDHILCLDCQNIFEFHDECIENRQNEISENSFFCPISHRHVIFAKCKFRKRN